MFKRLFDLTVAIVLLIILSPLLVIVSILVFILIGSPVFFKQRRAGLNSEVFEIIKFRTMNNKVDSKGELLPDNERLTRFGQFLRSSSIDELPELWNVIKGDMSLVGPRPLLQEYLVLYSEEQKRRHLVRPGITGLAQVSGRNSLSWEDKFVCDLWYVENHNLILDLKILVQTLLKVMRRSGVNQSDDVTSEKFRGNN